MKATHVPRSHAPWLWPLLAFGFVVAAYACVALWQITLPGVYMDAVNPDYLVVKVLNRHAQPISAWVLAANYVAGHKLPVLIALYHGSLPFWTGLPFFWLFGTDVTGLRLTHAMFGVAVLCATFLFLLRARVPVWMAALGCIALALDPSFSYAFRTQSYITLGSGAWMLWGAAALLHANDPLTQARRRWWVLAGFLYGISIFGYFVYTFFLPALVYAVLDRHGVPMRERMRGLLAWGSGLTLGLGGYWLGYALIIRERHGLRGFLSFLQEQEIALGIFSRFQQSLFERAASAWRFNQSILSNAWHHYIIFREDVDVPGAMLKTALLVGVPAALWLAAVMYRRASNPLRITIALLLSFFAVSLLFGKRLGGHHFVVLLPLFYVALVLGLRDVIAQVDSSVARLVLKTSPLLVLAVTNVAGQVHEGKTLARTRGVGLYSDAINRFAADLGADSRRPFMYLPDWGLSMPVALLTGGRVGVDTVENFQDALRRLCNGEHVGVAFVGADRDVRVARWQEKLQWAPPIRTPYAQANGEIVFEVAIFVPDAYAPPCRQPR